MRKRKYFLLLGLLVSLSFSLSAQIVETVKWDFRQERLEGNLIKLHFSATIDKGYHIYDLKLPAGGPPPTTMVFENVTGARLDGVTVALQKPQKLYEPVFEMDLSFFENKVEFVQEGIITDEANFSISGHVDYMSCNAETCIPAKAPFEFTFGAKPAAAPIVSATSSSEGAALMPTPVALPGTQTSNSENSVDSSTATAGAMSNYWEPVADQMKGEKEKSKMLWWIFLGGMLGGFLAIFTPCVWPIIPMTVSFFLKRTRDKAKGRRDALLYGLSIIAIYLLLGIPFTIMFGASTLNSLSTSAFFNLLFFALLVLFGISFLGAFEITLPSSWTTKLDKKAESTKGILSIFLMAFTLALVSFSCTGPIIGTLLVEVSVSGTLLGPAIGMLGFALALSIPFTLFAMFPSWMQSMPKSGGWLNVVKVTLGFLELAFALKFLSVADLAYGWGILDREVFLSLWIVLFFLLGLYLIGKLRFVHDSDHIGLSVHRFLLGVASFAFAIFMLPGLWGAPLKSISAFAPPLRTQDFNLYNDMPHPTFYDYDEGMNYAKSIGKPALIDFTGHGCVNCRKMENSVWSEDVVKELITKDYVLISLYVDEKKDLLEPFDVTENDKQYTIKTVGDKWSYLQRYKFGANAQPYYVLLDNNGMPLVNKGYTYSEDVPAFVRFLKDGLKNYQKNK